MFESTEPAIKEGYEDTDDDDDDPTEMVSNSPEFIR